MKKILIILIAIGFILSCKFLDKVEEQKADIIISLDYAQLNNNSKISKVRSTEINAASIDKASIVIFNIDYSYSSISNYQVDTNIQSGADNWTGYWIPHVQGQLNNISSNNCRQVESSNLNITGNSATGEFPLDPGVYNILVGLFENSNLKYVGASNIIDLRAGDSETVNISVDPINTAPIALFTVSPTSGTTETTFTFDASGSSDNKDATSSLQVRWDWENDGTWDTVYDTDKTENHKFSTAGTYTVKMEIKDTGELTGTYTRSVSVGVANTAPIASFTFSPTSGTTETTFTFDANGSSDNEDVTSVLQVRWDWNNNGSWDTDWSTTKTATHQFNSVGTFVVALQVKDTDDLTNTATKDITVSSSSHLIAYYPFNGNVNDESGNGLNGIAEGATLTTDRFGNTNSAYNFDGVDDYLQVAYGSQLTINAPFTFSAWINPVNLTSPDPVNNFIIFAQSYSNEEVYSLRVDENTIMCGHMGTGTDIPLNQWTLITVTMNEENKVSYYKNDQLIASLNDQYNSTLNGEHNSDLFIGKDANHFENHFNGKIDDIRIYNGSISSNEVSEIFDGYITPTNTSPIASFTVSPTSGTTATTFAFDANGSSDNEDVTSVLQVRWDWNNNGSWDTSYDTDKTETHQFSIAGTYTVKLEVKDTGGLADIYTKILNVGKDYKTFLKTYDSYEPALGKSAQETDDGGYIVFGSQNHLVVDDSDVLLFKADYKGEIIWEKNFGGTGNTWCTSGQITSDGGYILVGGKRTFNPEDFHTWIIKTDVIGNIQWEKTFSRSGWIHASSVQQTDDGGYIVGLQNSWGPVLLKIDINGNLEWENTDGNISCYSVKQTFDRGYIAVGTYDGDGDQKLGLLKTNINGVKEWEKIYTGDIQNNEWPGSVIQSDDGGYIVTGHINTGNGNDVWLFKTDINGNILWEKVFDDSSYEFGNDIQKTSDGSYVLVAWHWGDGIWIIKTDENGDIIWDNVINNIGPAGESYSIIETSDGGYLITGRAGSYENSHIFLLKIDNVGNLQ